MTQKIDLFSPLSPEAIAHKLKAIMEDDMPGKEARVLGKGSQFDMRLYYVRGRRDNGSLGKQLVATMEPERGGTRIKGTIKRSYGMFGFMFLWFGFLIFFMIVSNSLAFLTPEGFNFFNAIFFFGPLFMVIFGIYFFKTSLFQGGDDDVHILEFLKTELQAKDSSPQYKVY
jgi:hypothetical protein